MRTLARVEEVILLAGVRGLQSIAKEQVSALANILDLFLEGLG
jgi:hypothetical protein